MSEIKMSEKVSVPADEKETVWNKSQHHIGKIIEVYTTDPSDMRKYIKLANKYPDSVHVLKDDKYGMTFSIPVKWLKVIPSRKLSEEQRRLSAERLKAYHKAKSLAETEN